MKNSSLYIIMPIFNASSTLPRAINSLRCIDGQHRQQVHLIGVDDGSTDGSAMVFERAAVEVHGLKWTLLHRDNGGSGAARNEALRSFSVGWTLCLDADDELVMDPMPFIGQCSEATALLFDVDFYREENRIFKLPARRPDTQRLPQMFSARSPYCTLSIIFRRELLISLFAEDLRYLEDWYFWAVNPLVFSHCEVYRGTAIGRVHGSRQSKSANQYNNGYYRSEVAERLAKYWAEEKSAVVRNNLTIQNAIGKIQMGESAPLTTLLFLPATFSLYAKLLVYLFAYRLYLRLYPYA